MSRRSLAVDVPSSSSSSSADDSLRGFFPIPSPARPKKRLDLGRGGAADPPTLLVVDDDPTPQKPYQTRTPSFIAETPLSAGSAVNSDASIVKCTLARSKSSGGSAGKHCGTSSLIFVDSDNELEDRFTGLEVLGNMNAGNIDGGDANETTKHELFDACNGTSNIIQLVTDNPDCDFLTEEETLEGRCFYEEANICDHVGSTSKLNDKCDEFSIDKPQKFEVAARKKLLKGEKVRLIEERKRKRQEEKLRKEAKKAEAKQMKKLEKEKQKWEKGKFALKSIVTEMDVKVIESGAVGGHLLSRFSEKGLSFHITSNPIEGSILWRMNVPDQIAQHTSVGTEVPYVLIVYQAEEFCDLVSSDSFTGHVDRVRSQYPSFTICYVTNKLTSYIKKCEQSQFQNPLNASNWRRPPVEEVLSKLTTHFTKVHSRQCIDEAELADHVVGLTSSLANCQYRKKLTWLSVNANGSIIPKDFLDKKLIKNEVWLRALIAIPKVQPRHAIAIWKKFPTMRSLWNVYLDPTKSVHEKEFLLEDLMMEGPLGTEDRRFGNACSKRVYRIFMAQSGMIKTDDVEHGADFFG